MNPTQESAVTGDVVPKIRKRTKEPFVLLGGLILFFGYVGSVMGVTNMFNTIFATAHDLLMNTVLYIMGITVLAGAFSRLLVEFGLIGVMEKLLRPLMRPVFNLPGRASIAGLMTFFSDNPAIIGLAHDKRFSHSFKSYELISLTNFGTAFGMGLIVITFMATLDLGTGSSNFLPALIGFAGAIAGAVVSTRLMQRFIRPYFDSVREGLEAAEDEGRREVGHIDEVSQQSAGLRLLNAMLDGGKSGVELGLAIIPGVLIISSVVMILTFGAPSTGYTGSAYEGVALLPWVAGHFSWLFYGLFGFEAAELVAFPVTSLGAVGAAMSTVQAFIVKGIIGGNEIAVFTAMGMCWSGYLSTHTAMLDTLGHRSLTSKALLAHTVGGVVAGVTARYLYLAVNLLM
ncbi:nucleoside recognition domain-containing protein [Parendozoicomonas haliclonae]|uniref:Nucleoside recognition n=1 Tax=Parendozoicomonas haliclonae TaxID=1960125 RepID=A0A1X7AS34_9GAMM|nr:nucleoside recognition domain-containing protein [Parendozoicomonas haliclonae]SMA50908.1 Nucleoside recognition [Parendozoicomonas haliclonae]